MALIHNQRTLLTSSNLVLILYPIFISIIIENLVSWGYYPSRKTKSNQELLLVRGIERLNTRTLQVENKRTLEII